MKLDFIKEISTELIGIDGGNINSKLWFCGIEWIPFKLKDYPQFSHKMKGIEIPYSHIDVRGWSFDRNIGTIVSGWNNTDGQNFNYDKNEKNIFKLNLFPLKAENTLDWSDCNFTRTGCALKSEYYGKCVKYRFPLLHKLVTTFEPRVIVCLGREFIKEFIYAFWRLQNAIDNVKISKYKKDFKDSRVKYNSISNKIHVYQNEDNDKLPVIIGLPFFGPYLNSHKDMKKIGNYIAEFYPDTLKLDEKKGIVI